jgi:hypothetical protein
MKEIGDRNYYILSIAVIVLIIISVTYRPLLSQTNPQSQFKEIEIGVLEQRKIIENESEINRLLNRIEILKNENQKLLVNLFRENGIMYVGNEICKLDTKTGKLIISNKED